MSFTDKVILITGASSGIGAHVARRLAKLGGKVALVGRNEERLKGVVEQIKGDGSPTPLAIVADVAKDVERIISETIKHFGKLDVLINNAGMATRNTVETVDMAEYDEVMDVNVRSIVQLTKLAVPHLAKVKGNIVNVSSAAGLRPKENFMAYCMSKAAVNQFTKCCALDLAAKGIRVNAINPVVIRTAFFGQFGMDDSAQKDFFNKIGSEYPVGRSGEVTDTTAAIEYLASDAASFQTGLLLPVDGGALTAGK